MTRSSTGAGPATQAADPTPEVQPIIGRPDWDAVHRVTLRFRDPDLERLYRATVIETRRRRQRMSTFGGTAIFATLAVIAPILASLPIVPVTPLLLLLALSNLSAAIVLGHCRTIRQIDVVGISTQLSGGFLLLVLFVSIDSFVRFAAAGLMATAVFAFGVSRHPFRNAVVIASGQTIDFFAFGIAEGLAPGLFVDGFILAAAVSGACVGTYVSERGERRLFAQGLELGVLHRRVDDLLHRYLAPEVADAFIADPARAELGGEEAEVSVLFADLTGFTSFSERVRPDEAVAMLNRAFARAVPVVLGEGGTIVSFAGDAFMAIFNAPVRQPDHAHRAARAALALQLATVAGAEEPTSPRFRVGLNTGQALVGNIGTAELRTFTAIGDTTNLAARLQTFAPPGSVVLAERTLELLGDAANVRPLGEPDLKGKSIPVKAYELLGLRETAASAVRPAGT